MNREVNLFHEIECTKIPKDKLEIVKGETNLKEIYDRCQCELELETVKYASKLEQRRDDQDKLSMGNTLLTPMKFRRFVDGQELH